MKKILYLIMAMLIMAACSTQNNDEKIRAKIIRQKEQLHNITKKYEDKIADLESQLTDTNDVNKYVPVEVKAVQPEEFNHYIVVFGNVEAKDYGKISPEMSGRIDKIYVQAGEYAKKGDLLLTLNTDAIEGNIESLQANLDLAKSTFEKQEKLWKEGIGSEMQFLQSKATYESTLSQLEALTAQQKMSQLRAPYNGYVDKIFIKEGELAGMGFPVMEFVNLTNMVIKADVSENYVKDIKIGQKVRLTLSSIPDYEVYTPIVRKAKVIDKISRTFEIELHIKNSDGKILPNMVSTIQINDFSSEKALVIPSLVIRRDITGDYVYIVSKKNGKPIIEKRYITTSLSYNENTMIAEGLNAGDKVVTKGYHLVSSGMPVNVVNN